MFEVKPWEAGADLKGLFEKIKQEKIDGLVWGEAYKLVPVAFGVKKLVLSCVVVDSKVSRPHGAGGGVGSGGVGKGRGWFGGKRGFLSELACSMVIPCFDYCVACAVLRCGRPHGESAGRGWAGGGVTWQASCDRNPFAWISFLSHVFFFLLPFSPLRLLYLLISFSLFFSS